MGSDEESKGINIGVILERYQSLRNAVEALRCHYECNCILSQSFLDAFLLRG